MQKGKDLMFFIFIGLNSLILVIWFILGPSNPVSKVPKVPPLYLLHALSFSPDGENLAVGISEQLRIFDAKNLKQKYKIDCQDGWVMSLAYGPEGKTLFAGSWTKITAWDIKTGKELFHFSNPDGWVYSLAISPDGKILASGSTDGMLKLWDLNKKELLCKIKQSKEGGVTAVAFSPDGKMLASGDTTWTIKFWDVAKQKELATVGQYGRTEGPGHSEWVMALAFEKKHPYCRFQLATFVEQGRIGQNRQSWRSWVGPNRVKYTSRGASRPLTPGGAS